MRFVQFEDSGNRRVGVELKENGDIVDLCKGNAAIPYDMRSFIEDSINVTVVFMNI
jgi:hypothetical protein